MNPIAICAGPFLVKIPHVRTTLLTLAVSILLACSSPSTAQAGVLTDFSSADTKLVRWQIVDDRVMGGRSRGRYVFSPEGTLVFKGNLSLENNGGFSSVRSGSVDLDLSDSAGLSLRVRGDGRTYQLRLNTTARFRSWDVSFQAYFATVKDQWIDVFIPFDRFTAGFRGWSLPDVAFDPSAIKRIGLLLGDKKPGAFRLEVDSISTYLTEAALSSD